VVVTFVAGVAIDRFTSASTQDPDLSKSFAVFGFRGLLIASRALFIFGVAVLVGAIISRAPGRDHHGLHRHARIGGR
jgi:hypothetical protein